ncbi:DMT family transporter [Aeromonas salmonicida]|uniref:DMT family transporter n=1 Tax=Aeromonas salmonicida TaxID=645 RepID=UPI00259DC5B0|nr:DMT family transporter [Aeromonas salmonicida]MDM5113709.1 DMT family transporter [Aeromonas salmonicida]
MSFTLSPRCRGWSAALATALLWSGFFLSLRLGAEEKLPPQTLALLRFGIPALLLLPYYWRHRTRLHSVPLRWQLAMLTGAGLPFFWLGATGMQLAPVAQGSALIPGTAPLMVSLLGLLLWREPCPAQRRCGLSLIALATATLLLSGEPGLWQGQVCFLGAALLWALFTLAVRHSGLAALDAAALVAVPSALLLLPTLLWSPLPTVDHASIWLWQGLLQGIGAGLLAALCYAHAIRTLGAEISSALGSLTPVMAAMLAWWLLGETISQPVWLALGLLCVGVVLASLPVWRGSGGGNISYATSGAAGDRADRSQVASFCQTPAAGPAWRDETWQRR